jgi:hypothetical protein
MGTQTTSIHWAGLSRLLKRPPWWRFAYAPTAIPGATRVRIDVSPWGKVIATEPADLEDKIRAFRNRGY